MIHLDTSLLVDPLTGSHRSGMILRQVLAQGENLQISTIVLYEWLRGPRSTQEIADQEELFPDDTLLPFEEPDTRIGSLPLREEASDS